VFAWVQSTQSFVFGGIETQQAAEIRAAGSQMTLLSVDSSTAKIRLQNTGKYDLSDFKLYVNGTPTSYTGPSALTVGQIGDFIPTGLTSGKYYEVKITTPYTHSAVSFTYG
jgi:uncharacterized membrane protein